MAETVICDYEFVSTHTGEEYYCKIPPHPQCPDYHVFVKFEEKCRVENMH